MTDGGSFDSHIQRHLRKTQQSPEEAERMAIAIQQRARVEAMLNDPAGTSPESVMGKEAGELCKEFLALMESKGYPGQEPVMGNGTDYISVLGSVEIPQSPRRRSFIDIAFMISPDPPEVARGVPFKGYSIGGLYQYKPQPQAVEGEIEYNNRLKKFAEASPAPTYPDGLPVYLCTDGRLRNWRGGSIPPTGNKLITGISLRSTVISFNPPYSMGVYHDYLAEIPLEDLLPLTAIQWGAVDSDSSADN